MVAFELGDIREPGLVLPQRVKPALLAGKRISDKGCSNISRPRTPPVKEIYSALRRAIIDFGWPAVEPRLPGELLVAPLAVARLNELWRPGWQGDFTSV